MKEKENIKICEYSGTWHVIDELKTAKDNYYLLENEQIGDEIYSLVVNESKSLVLKTYDDIMTTLEDNDIEFFGGDRIFWDVIDK